LTWRRQLPAWSPVTVRALAAGAFTSRGDRRPVESLDARVRSEYGATLVQFTESGTAALALAMLAAARDGSRPRVAMPAWACYDLMTAADIADAEVILYDLDPGTLAPEALSFADALAQRPTSVIVAHWFGIPVPLGSLMAATRDAGATFIEDAAQGVEGRLGERPLGALGDFGILSFGRGKGRTGGVGGALLANSAASTTLLQRIRHRVAPPDPGKRGLLALAAQWASGRPYLYVIPSSIRALRLGETIYHPPAPIREMPEWAAAVVGSLWLRSAQEGPVRRAAAARWAGLLASHTTVRTFTECVGAVAGWLRFPLLVDDPTALLDGDARRLGVMPGYQGLLADLPLAPGRLVNGGPWPGAAQLASRLRTLPTHGLLRPVDIAAIVRLLGRGEHRNT
jgi:dTDP-4-amino-4,6-dideoxygalactose transaminase